MKAVPIGRLPVLSQGMALVGLGVPDSATFIAWPDRSGLSVEA